MTRINTLILFGFLVILAPFSGLPIAFRTFLEVIFGIVVLWIGLAMRAEEARKLHASGASAEPAVSEPAAPEPPSTISPI